MKKFLFVLLASVLNCTPLYAQSSENRIVEGAYYPNALVLKNYVKNSTCDKNVNNLTGSGVTPTASGTNAILGAKSCSVDASASNQSVTWTTYTFEKQMYGQKCMAQFDVRGDASLYNMRVLQNSVIVSNNFGAGGGTQNLANTGTSIQTVKLPFPCGDGSFATTLVLTSSGNGAQILVDNVYIGLSPKQDNFHGPQNLGLEATVAANALTLSLKTAAGKDPSPGDPVIIPFRSLTQASGVKDEVWVTTPIGLVITAGSTLGGYTGSSDYYTVYAGNNSGTAVLGISRDYFLDEAKLKDFVAEGGTGQADTGLFVYATAARNDTPMVPIGRIRASQNGTGLWNGITAVTAWPFRKESVSSNEVNVNLNFANIANNGTATITSQTNNWVSSVVREVSGVVAVNITPSTFITDPSCFVSPRSTGNIFGLLSTNHDNTIIKVITTSDAGTRTDVAFDLMCVGVR